MSGRVVVDHERWLAARETLLAKEKAFTRQRDELARARRELPWEAVEKAYRFDTETGPRTLAELFDGRRQLAVYHFMFGPDWEAGCPSCSLCADSFDRNVVHLAQRDVTMIAISRAPLAKLLAYRERMGWAFPWASSLGTDFNRDFHVTFDPEEIERGDAFYNYRRGGFPVEEAPGLSFFYRDDEDGVYHTYSTYGRGLDLLIAAYNIMDLAPMGRDEDALEYPMAWVRRRDEYA